MKTRVFAGLIVLLSLAAGTLLSSTADNRAVTVHEWGTFTSVAGEDGLATPWRTYGGRDDLPCFVNTFGGFKFQVLGTVRMETPVLYFYGSQNTVADVKVLFPKGTMTEWYPRASTQPANTLEWRNIQVLPDAAEAFPAGTGPSHYYTARQTDAAPLQVGSQKEKFLFYRGVGNFPLPISARVTADDKVVFSGVDGQVINGVIYFENRAGKLGFKVLGTLNDEVTVNRESLQSGKEALLASLETALIGQGLYPKEARAMVQTWSDSWLEEGARVFYIVPRQTVDTQLPLSIVPRPVEIDRVFVGRMEILTPQIQDEVRQAVARQDRAALEKYGRFLEPIAKRIGATDPILNSVYAINSSRATDCSQ